MICTYNEIYGFFKCALISLGGTFILLTILSVIVIFLFSIGRK
jgi:hypothetical protein